MKIPSDLALFILQAINTGVKNTKEYIQLDKISLLRERYIGMSMIAAESEYDIWCWWSGKVINDNEISTQLHRVFHAGHVFEQLTIMYLKNSGAFKDEDMLCQVEYSDYDGRFKGHSDLLLPNCVVEHKALNNENFEQFKLLGLRKYNKVYAVQCQLYCHYSGRESAVLVAYNKDNSKYWAEEIKYNPEIAEYYVNKAGRILNSLNGEDLLRSVENEPY